ncbi:MAG: hypothetical protein II288_05050 [Alistipes sp.]|nr:hypothetical protein [Alistipes sp.]
MKRLFYVLACAALLVACKGSGEGKYSDQRGYHQAIENAAKVGTAICNAESYDDFLKAADEAKSDEALVRHELGGYSYLAYLKGVLSAMNGKVLSENNLDYDEDIMRIFDYYHIKVENSDNGGSDALTPLQEAENQAYDLGYGVLDAMTAEEFAVARTAVEEYAATLRNSGDVEAYTLFVETFNSVVAEY